MDRSHSFLDLKDSNLPLDLSYRKVLLKLVAFNLLTAGVAERFRRWAADPLYMGSIPIPGSN